jgi:hypothetical protein
VAFSQASITAVRDYLEGPDRVVEWDSTAPEGTVFHVYEGTKLRRSTRSRRVHLPIPRARSTVHVGAVDPSEANVDLSGSLPATPPDRVRLDWLGGTFLASDIAGFSVYGSAVANGPVDYDTVLADVPAYAYGVVTDGWGMGGWDQGVWGHAASSYSWTSDPLSSGDWTFAVVPYTTSGNAAATPVEVAETILVAPRPPAANPEGKRLTYTYDEPSGVATLNWLASPG